MSDSTQGASSVAPRFHGLAGDEVRFGAALWPYDVLLRFGYDLPENEHLWDGEWLDDRFEAASLDMRSTAARLVFALRAMHGAVGHLRALSESERPALAELKAAVEETPLALDLVLAYLQRLLDGFAAVIPCCYGNDGRVLDGARGSLADLAAHPATAGIDPALPALLQRVPALDVATAKAELYVIAESDGFSAALPKAAARTLHISGDVTLAAAGTIGERLAAVCDWFDDAVHHLQQVVAGRTDPGEELTERWADPNWSIVLRVQGHDAALEAYLPAIAEP